MVGLKCIKVILNGIVVTSPDSIWPDCKSVRPECNLRSQWIDQREINTFCVVLFHNAGNDIFFARLVKRKNLTHPSLNFQSGRTDFQCGELAIG